MRDPKNLAEWIELDYYRRPRPMRRLRRRASWIILFLCSGLVLVGLVLGNHMIYQAGPVSGAHTMFNKDCASCHTEPLQTARRLWPTASSVRTVPDEACLNCHAGAIHNDQQATQPQCVSCHREHRGRHTLSRIPNQSCTACHANLQRQDGLASSLDPVTSFATAHPEFHFLTEGKADPGQIRFNHARHLASGGLPRPDGKTEVLDCSACHQADANREYMRPINYDAHCARCHPLNVQIAAIERTEQNREALQEFERKTAPHRPPEEIEASLRQRLHRLFQQIQPRSEPPGDRALSGWLAARQGQEDAWVGQQLNEAERVLFSGGGGCRHCHTETRPWQPGGGLPVFAAARVPARWMPLSHFSHDSHRVLRCDACHEGVDKSTKSSDVLMPGIKTCRECHNPTVGVTSECVDCHRYHDRSREHGLEGKQTLAEALGR